MSLTPSSILLADLIDLEVVLARQEAGEAPDGAAEAVGREVLTRRGVAVTEARAAVSRDRELRLQLAHALLARARAAGPPLPGDRVVRGYRGAGWLLGALALILGTVAARGALSFSGGDPINVWRFLGGLVLLQVALLVVLVVALTVGFARGAAWLSTLQRGLLVLSRMSWFDRLARHTAAQAREAFRGLELVRHRAATRRSLYRDAERWLLFGLTQRFALLFNLAAAATFLALVLFTDLVFAWSTTPAEIDGGHLALLVDALAAPWSWLLPDTVPSMEAIEATRWSRLEQAFAGGDPQAAATFAAGWWSFLFVALLVWGLLPRLIAWLVSGWKLRRALAAAPLDDVATMDLLESMIPAVAPDWIHPSPESVSGELLQRGAGGEPGPAGPPGEAGAAVLWGGWKAEETAVRELLAAHRGWRPAALLLAGGSSEGETRAALESLDETPLVVLVESGESPDKRCSRFLKDARGRLGPSTLITVGLVEPSAGGGFGAVADQDLALWRDYLARLRDPYLRVEALRT